MLDVNFIQNQRVGFHCRKSLREAVDICAYTGKKLLLEERTVEHIKPLHPARGWKKEPGINNMNNLLITGHEINDERRNRPFYEWVRSRPDVVKNIQNYLDRLRGIIINNRDYVEEVKNTLNYEARGIVVFKGNNL